MREIKFRQPVFADDKFHHFHYWGFIDGGFDGISTGVCSVGNAREYSQQYTGLKDKNGIESYHKDIIKRNGELYIVEWHDNLAGWFLKPIHGAWHGNTQTDMSLMCEIIGNVWENPELLGENNEI